MFFGWAFFLISAGSPHVRPMGCTRGGPDEIELTAIGVKLNGSQPHLPHGPRRQLGERRPQLADLGKRRVGELAVPPRRVRPYRDKVPYDE